MSEGGQIYRLARLNFKALASMTMSGSEILECHFQGPKSRINIYFQIPWHIESGSYPS